jgi:hypothetical protein
MPHDDLNRRLEELIEASPAINSLSDEEKKIQVEKIMNAPDERKKEIIKLFEDEQNYVREVEEEFKQHADEVKAFELELTDTKRDKEREELKKAEILEHKKAKKKASSLIEKLEEATKEQEKSQKKEKTAKKSRLNEFLKNKLTLKKFGRFILAAIIGAALCGLAGILIVFGIIFAMGEYVQLDVVYSMEPLISFNAYWFALIYGSLIGLLLIPLLRLMKKKSFFLSLLLGGIIGALLIAGSHMAFGLDSDIVLLWDAKPLHLRGYWVAIAFAVVVGFLGQFAYRLINLGEFFKLTSEQK